MSIRRPATRSLTLKDWLGSWHAKEHEGRVVQRSGRADAAAGVSMALGTALLLCASLFNGRVSLWRRMGLWKGHRL